MAENYGNLLTPGILEKMKNGESDSTHPVLQLIGAKRIAADPSNPESAKCYRLIVSDGVGAHSFVLLAISLNGMFEAGELTKYCIFEVERYKLTKVDSKDSNDRKYLVFFKVKVLHTGSDVGHIVTLTNTSISSSSATKENANGNASTSTKQQTSEITEASVVDAHGSAHLTLPIESLSPYQNKWTIKARVTAKSPIRTWNNAKGEGKLFSFDVCDESGEIRVSAFRDMVDKFFDMIVVDKVYYISKCQIKAANKQYSKVQNDYELTIWSETQIQLCEDEDEANSIPKIRYDFITIGEIAKKQADSIVDVIGICREATEATNLVSKASGRELTKRDITLVDSSNTSIVLTLWGDEAANFINRDNPVILLKSAMLKEYNGGKTLTTSSSTVLIINPDIREGHQIRDWYENAGSSATFNTLSAVLGGMSTEWMTLHDMKEKQPGNGDKPDYFQLVGMVHSIRHSNMVYKACSVPECNKKVDENDDGTYRCEKCAIDSPTFKNRLLVNALIGDWTSNCWVTLFADVAEQILGKNGDEIAALLEGEKLAMESYMYDRQFRPMMFQLRTKVETFGDVPRPKTTALSVAPIPYKEYNAMLLKNIRRHTGISKSE